MYELHFTGIEADKLLNTISVVGNNNADIIDFVVDKVQHSISLAGYNCYIKVETKSGSYFNKEKLTVEERGDKLHCPWTLTWDYTQYKELQCQLQFQSDDGEEVVWQSRIFYLKLQNTLGVDGMISSKYPTILTQLESEVATFEGRIHTLELKTPIIPIDDSEAVVDLPDASSYQLYRYYDSITEQPSNFLTLISVRKALVATQCITTRNNVTVNTNNIASFFDSHFSDVVTQVAGIDKAYTAYFENSEGQVVCQAIRLGTAKAFGTLDITLPTHPITFKLRVGKYFNYYDDEPHYDADAQVIINGDEYELPEGGYIDIEYYSEDGEISIESFEGRIHIYALMVEGSEDEKYEEEIPTCTWCYENFYDKSQVDLKIGAIQPGTKLYKHVVRVEDNSQFEEINLISMNATPITKENFNSICSMINNDDVLKLYGLGEGTTFSPNMWLYANLNLTNTSLYVFNCSNHQEDMVQFNQEFTVTDTVTPL